MDISDKLQIIDSHIDECGSELTGLLNDYREFLLKKSSHQKDIVVDIDYTNLDECGPEGHYIYISLLMYDGAWEKKEIVDLLISKLRSRKIITIESGEECISSTYTNAMIKIKDFITIANMELEQRNFLLGSDIASFKFVVQMLDKKTYARQISDYI